MMHADYPHDAGTLYDCHACESTCYCAPGHSQCVHCAIVADRLEYLRGEIRAERISWGELADLQGLAAHIPESDTELREWAGIPEGD